MENMDSPKDSGIMVKLGNRVKLNRKGFSLIEMAIVLVIIGIVIAAIMKGQDLLFNSRTKQLVTAANGWKVAAYGYMDRNNRFPGDLGRNGNISDDATEQAIATTATGELAIGLSNVPPNPVVIGGQSYWMYFGTMDSTINGGKRNIITICPSVDCQTGMSPDDVEMIKALDISLDGVADAGIGSLRALAIQGGGYNTLADAAGARNNGWIAATDTLQLVDTSADGTTQPWVVSTEYGAVWAFDKKF